MKRYLVTNRYVVEDRIYVWADTEAEAVVKGDNAMLDPNEEPDSTVLRHWATKAKLQRTSKGLPVTEGRLAPIA